jgi:sialate O-acetylesterase
MRHAASLALCLLISVPVSAGADDFAWPGGVKGAVSLTYDDGLDSQLDVAIPDLDAANLQATFYVTGSSASLKARMDEWRALADRGHELGNHSLFHPCLSVANGERREWVRPEQDLENYTVGQMIAELSTANTLLAAVDGRRERSYAYTCTDEVAGGHSYVEELQPLFSSARAGQGPASDPELDGRPQLATDVRALDLYRVPSWPVVETSAEEMIAFVERAAASGGLAVLMFHGVGGDYLSVSGEDHRQLVEYLDANRHRLWTDTFLNVTKHVEKERERLGR